MTSLVTDVLNSAGLLAKEDITSKVENLKVKIEDIKIEVQESLKNSFIDFIPQYVKFDKLVNRLNSVKNEYDMLVDQIEREIKPQMNNAIVEYHEMQDDLKKINCLRVSVLQLIELHEYFEAAKNALNKKAYMECIESLVLFEDKFKEIDAESQKDTEIIRAIRTDFTITRENLKYQLTEMWKDKVSIEQIEGNKKCKYLIVITLKTETMLEFSNAIYSMESIDELRHILRFFGNQFLKLVCEPIVMEQVEIKRKNDTEQSVITIYVLKKDDDPDFKSVFQHLIELFQTLHQLLFKWPINVDDENGHNTLMEKFGSIIGEEFCTMLVEKCIKPAVPTYSKGIESFQQAIDQAINLQNTLQQLGFFNSQNNSLMSFLQNVDDLPANKMALDLLSRARELMKQDLYQTIVVGVEKKPDVVTTDSTGDLNQISKTTNSLSKATFAFPVCQISVFAKDLVKLLHEVMHEAKNLQSQNPIYSLKLFCTARNICDLYCSVVPTFHRDAITNIPSQTAIHHNNCFYIAHDLLTLGPQFDLQSFSFHVTFVDLVSEMKRIGTEAFLAQMRNQRQHILSLLQDQEAFQVIGKENTLSNKAEKTVHQCLNQLQLLKRAWSDVLPIEVYFKAMGTLLNTFMEEIILRILSLEDIAAQTASELDSVFGIVLMQSPDLFKVARGDKSDEVHNYVQRWFKFQELQLILSASLVEIVDRWSSSKGPLASYFSPEEVKHLIRALFQNTERRAAALGKIR